MQRGVLSQTFAHIRIREGHYLKGRVLSPTHRDADSLGSGWGPGSYLCNQPPRGAACEGGWPTTQAGPWRVSHQTPCTGCAGRDIRRLQRTPFVGAGRSPQWDPPPPLTSRFAKYYKLENGSEYRTLLKAFGIRFDVLVYGNVSRQAGREGGWTGEGNSDQPGPGEGSWAGVRGRVLLLTSSETLSSPSPYLHHEGVGPAAPRSLWPHPCPAGLRPLALVFVHTGGQVQHHPHHHQLRGRLHLCGSGEFSPAGSHWWPVRVRGLLAGVGRELNPGKPRFSLWPGALVSGTTSLLLWAMLEPLQPW